MSAKFIMIVAALAAVGSIGFFFMAGGPDQLAAQKMAKTDQPSIPPVKKESLPQKTEPLSITASPSETSVAPDGEPAAEKQQILTVIDDAAITYSADELPKIQPYLLHPDPEIRAAALQGFVTISEPAGAPLLRAAAQLAPSAEEAAAMRDAAAYIELPPASLLKKNGKASKQ